MNLTWMKMVQARGRPVERRAGTGTSNQVTDLKRAQTSVLTTLNQMLSVPVPE